MLATYYRTIYTRSSLYLCVAILPLTMLVGCTANHAEQTAKAEVQGVVCVNDTDTFCIENDRQKATKINQQGFERASRAQYDEALALFKQAIALDDSNQEYYYNMGLAYSFKGMVAEEEAAYLAGLATKPVAQNFHRRNSTVADIYYNLACLYALQNKKDQAFEYLDKLAALDFDQAFHFSPDDKDLDSLRDDPRFKGVLDKLVNSGKPSAAVQPPSQ